VRTLLINGDKFQRESDIVERFLRALGYTQFTLADPNAGKKTDTGADVSVPQVAAIVSTFLWEPVLDLDQMNATLSPILQSSAYSSAYLYNMMGKGGPSVHEWTRDTAVWRKIPRKSMLD
jgi:hypothetical protein